METLDTAQRKARVEHICNYCGGVIKKGESYQWSKHIIDGNIYEWKAHTHCLALVSLLDMSDYDEDGVGEDTFYEAVNDTFSDNFTLAEKASLLHAKLIYEKYGMQTGF